MADGSWLMVDGCCGEVLLFCGELGEINAGNEVVAAGRRRTVVNPSFPGSEMKLTALPLL